MPTEKLAAGEPAQIPLEVLPLHQRGLEFCNELYKRQGVIRENNAAALHAGVVAISISLATSHATSCPRGSCSGTSAFESQG